MIDYINSIDPRLFYLAVSGFAWLMIYLWRRISFASWTAVTKGNPVYEKLPSIILSGLLTAAPAINKGLVAVVVNLVAGAILGAGGATLMHRLLKISPLPYTGATPPLFPPPAEPVPE